jgi:hypothetical protein
MGGKKYEKIKIYLVRKAVGKTTGCGQAGTRLLPHFLVLFPGGCHRYVSIPWLFKRRGFAGANMGLGGNRRR